MVVSILNVASVSGTSMPLAGSPLAGDVLVVVTGTIVASPTVPTAMTGWGATWTLAHTSARSTVWVGTGATTGGSVVLTGGSTASAAVWHLRGVDPVVEVSETMIATASTLGEVAPLDAGTTRAVLGFSRSGGALTTSSTPGGAWTGGTATNRAWAHAIPTALTTYVAKSTSGAGAPPAGAVAATLTMVLVGTPPPLAPTGLTLIPAETEIDVDWIAPAGLGPALGYDVRVNGGAPVDVGNVLTHTLTGLTPATTYAVDVRGYNAAGDGPWVSGSVDTLGVPGAPTGLILTPAETEIDVDWTAPVGPETVDGYFVTLDGGIPVDVGNVLTHTFIGLSPATLYDVDVVAYSVAGEGPPVSGTVMTSSPPVTGGYTATLRVGAHTWAIDTDNPAAYGPTTPIRFGWTAREDDGWPTQHEPTILSFGVIVASGEDFDDVDQDTWVHFTFTPEGFTEPLVDFGGKVRDLVAFPHRLGMIYGIVAVDPLQLLREDYRINAFVPDDTPSEDVWSFLVQDADPGGSGIRPALPVDPLDGQTKPGFVGGFTEGAQNIDSDAWSVLVGFLGAFAHRHGATPAMQRVILSYQLDGSGELDPDQPFVGTWMRPPVEGDLDVADVDACLLRTDATEWSRPRTEPNIAGWEGFYYERTHTGPDIVRTLDPEAPAWANYTDPVWILYGREAPSQWATKLELLADQSPETVAGWFTMPDAMRTFVTTDNIDPRHTPDGSGDYAGLLSGATLLIRGGGSWSVEFTLRRTLPEVAP